MVPDKDYYADKDGKLTDDPTKFAAQVATAGVFLDERIAKRYGIRDTLVSTDEPNAPRRVTGGDSVHITKAEDQEEEPQKPAVADEPEVEEQEAEEPTAETAKPAAKKGEKKK